MKPDSHSIRSECIDCMDKNHTNSTTTQRRVTTCDTGHNKGTTTSIGDFIRSSRDYIIVVEGGFITGRRDVLSWEGGSQKSNSLSVFVEFLSLLPRYETGLLSSCVGKHFWWTLDSKGMMEKGRSLRGLYLRFSSRRLW